MTLSWMATAPQQRPRDGPLRRLVLLCLSGATAAIAFSAGEVKAADKVRISGLSDVAFGTISNFAADSIRNQDICVYAKGPPPPDDGYAVTASGSGSGGAFLLSSGSDTLPYQVQWNATSGQSSGTQLLANQPLTGLQTGAGAGAKDDCSKGPATTASLIVILRSSALSAAASGTYSGTLTLLVSPN